VNDRRPLRLRGILSGSVAAKKRKEGQRKLEEKHCKPKRNLRKSYVGREIGKKRNSKNKGFSDF